MFHLIKKGAAKLRSLFFLIIFPKKCLSCGAFDSYFCVDCQRLLTFLLECSDNSFPVYSLFSYKTAGIASLIHAFKYGAVTEVFIELEKLLLRKKVDLDYFLPRGDFYYLAVPLHWKRLRERGYNQSEKLAEMWQRIWGGQILKAIVKRKSYTKAQAKLGRAERLQNLKGKFILEEFDFSQIKRTDYLVLVDDVFTTGSTLNEIYNLLKEKWPGRIIGLTLARD